MAEPEIAATEISPSSGHAADAAPGSGDPTDFAPEMALPVDAEKAEDESPKGEEEFTEEPSEGGEEATVAPLAVYHKRKRQELQVHDDGNEQVKRPENEAPDQAAATEEAAAEENDGDEGDAKRPHLDGNEKGDVVDGEEEVPIVGVPTMENGQLSGAENIQQTPVEDMQRPDFAVSDDGPLSRRIEVPSNKVGVLIGKAGETIRNMQNNSGAKIQITRDADADPNSTMRPVELIGKLEEINKAEQLIKAVIAEADAGGSPSLVAMGFDTAQIGAEEIEIAVPNEKVGLVIGKGGQTIKNLQTKSGARIQLIPQHLPEGEASKERTVRVTGSRKQIDAARELIKDVMNQVPARSSNLSGGHSQQTFRARAPPTQPQWGSHAPQTQPTGYDYQQRGMYPSQNAQYPSQPYGGYSQQPPPRSGYGSGWEQRPVASGSQTGGYDYYGQRGQPIGSQAANPVPAPAPAPASAPNYNYGQSQAPGYGQPPPYGQPTSAQGYGHGYEEPKYGGQAPHQQYYGHPPPLSSQPGAYPQAAGAPQSGYGPQQPYSKPAYGASPQVAAQSYGPPRANQPGDPIYQGSAPNYGSGPAQQPYPYGSSAPSQPVPYGQPYGPSGDGYNQPSTGYSQPAPGYGPGGQAAPAYPQPGAPATGGYGQYPTSQPGYADQPAPNNVNYGYQGGSAEGGYGSSHLSGNYAAAPVSSNQAGYGQPATTMPGYEQTMQPQPPYGGHPSGAPAGYAKSLSPQPAYGGQYDSAQMYGHH